MILMLEVTGPEAEKLGAARRREFHAVGGTIGRLPDNSWVLPDPYVSSRHALIRYQSGAFYIEDTSTNGVFINSPDNRLTPGQPYALQSGDWIFIDPYEIRATVTARAEPPAPLPDDPFGLNVRAQPDAFAAPEPFPASPLDPIVPGPQGGAVDPLSLLGFEPRRMAPPAAPTAADLARNSVLSDHYQPPAPVAPVAAPSAHAGLIPDDYDPLRPDDRSSVLSPPPPPAPPQRGTPSDLDPRGGARPRPDAAPVRPAPQAYAPSPVAAATPAAGLEEVLAGAGLKNVEVTPELAHAFGEILRVVVSGVMDVLQARQRIKNEFRMRMTSFRPAQNNPLKFSANVDDALHNLLVKRNAAYLGPVEAFEDAFDDLRNHQMATLAGVRVAFEAMLAEFDPARLQDRFDRQLKKGSLIAVPAKLRYWELYRDRFSDMVKDADTCFRELFGEEFTKAYEEQLDRLKAQGRAGKR